MNVVVCFDAKGTSGHSPRFLEFPTRAEADVEIESFLGRFPAGECALFEHRCTFKAEVTVHETTTVLPPLENKLPPETGGGV